MKFRLLGALLEGVDRLSRDPGARHPQLKTGTVIVEMAQEMAAVPRIAALQAALETKLARPRYVGAADEIPPIGRTVQVAPWIEERWTAVPKELTDTELWTVAATGIVPIAGWRVTQHVTLKATWMDMDVEARAEVLMSINAHVEDDAIYNGYYPTIKGDDVAHHEIGQSGMRAFQGGDVIKGNAKFNAAGDMIHDGTIRGGTEIRGGRAEWRRKTKNYAMFDKGYFKHVERIRAQKQAEREARQQTEIEKVDALLPRRIGEL